MKRTPLPNSRIGNLTSVAAAVMAALHGGQVLATDAPAPSSGGADTSESPDSAGVSAGAFAEVLVTASRRQSSAQDLPMSITAVSASQLEQAGIEVARDGLEIVL